MARTTFALAWPTCSCSTSEDFPHGSRVHAALILCDSDRGGGSGAVFHLVRSRLSQSFSFLRLRSRAATLGAQLVDKSSQLKATKGVYEEAGGKALLMAKSALQCARLFRTRHNHPTAGLQTGGHLSYFSIYGPRVGGWASRDAGGHDLCLSGTPSRVRM